MLTVRSVSDADYYLRTGAGCGSPKGGAGGSAAEYELSAISRGEPPGRWFYPHRNDLGVDGEIHAEGPSGDAFREVLNHLRHPVSHEQLGRPPMRYASAEERVAKWRRKNPGATEEQEAAERVRAEGHHQHAVHAFDMTFSAPKSWSVLHAALQYEGRTEEAAELAAALAAGVDAAMTFAADEVGFTRRGSAGPKVAGRSTMEYVRESDFQTAVFAHHTSRDLDPQLHFHVMLLNRIRSADGQWRAPYSPAILKNKHMLDSVFLRVAEAEATERLGVRFAARPDGKAREVVGVPAEIRDLFSSRTRAVDERTQEKLDQWCALHGATEVPALIKWRIQKQATLDTRRAKAKDAPDRDETVREWDAKIAAEFREGFTAVVDETDEAATRPAPPPGFDPDVVIALALEELTDRKAATSSKATWNRSHLIHAIDRHLPDMLAIEPARVPALLAELADRALAGPQVVSLAAPAVAAVPASLRDVKTGESVFESPTTQRFTTTTHLAREDAIVARLQREGAPVLTEASAAEVLEGRGLSPEQLAVATAILTSPRQLEVVNAAAGTGKSRLMAALSDASAATWGHGLTGFTVSENAAGVLRGEGVARAHNIAAFLDFRERERRGDVSMVERAQFAVPRDATVVVDEASMVSTPQLTDLLRELDTAGVGRVVMIGDTAQVEAVDAGGAFGLLVEQRAPHTLTQVRRFTHEWEADASARLRDGDLEVLAQYDARARIRGGGEPEDVERDAVRAFVTDHLSGQESVLVVGTGETAARLSSEIRRELVGAGHVVEAGVTLHDHTTAGVGDLVQTRQNDRSLGVVNRQVWQVVAVDEAAGTMDVRLRADESDRTTTLPAVYVGEHVELAYASTVEAVQGRTVDTGHVLVDDAMGRSRLYPALTRGRDANTAWVPVVAPPRRERESDEEYAARVPTPMAAMVAAMEREDRSLAARTVIAEELARSTNLGHLGPQWQQLVAEHRALGHLDVLHEVLGDRVHAVAKDPALDGVLHQVRAAEVAGHDPREVLEAAARFANLESSRSPAAVLYRRLEEELRKLPERGEDGAAASYAARTPVGGGERMEYARAVAEAMDARAAELGDQAVVEPPAWATDLLGAVPQMEAAQAAWRGKVAVVAAYREQYGWSHPTNPIGRAPSRGEPERRWAWERAAEVLGYSRTERDLAAASDAELGRRVLAWRREQEWMPRNVDADLRTAYLAREEAHREVVEARTRGEDSTVVEAEAATVEARIDRLELVARGRAVEVERTERTRDAGQEALRELDRRVSADRAAMDRAAAERAPERAAEEQRAADDARVHAAVAERWREQWVRDAPVFGSERWADLGDDAPERRASIFNAALQWWRMGDPRDADRDTERLAEHGLEQAPPEYALTRRGLERVRAGEDEQEVQRSEPSRDVEVLAEVHRVTSRDLKGDAPEFGSPAYADAEEPERAKAETRAALRWFGAGDTLDARAERADAADEREAAAAISRAVQESRHPLDNRSRAEVARARGDERIERPLAEVTEPEREEPARPDVSWTREQPDVEREAPQRDDLAEQVARAQAAIERLREEPVVEQTQEPDRAPVAEREGVER